MNKEHKLKTWTPLFEGFASRRKTFDYRKNDRDFKLAEYLLLREWNPGSEYTGREIRVQIAKIWTPTEIPGLPNDYVIMEIYEMSRKGFEEDKMEDKQPAPKFSGRLEELSPEELAEESHRLVDYPYKQPTQKHDVKDGKYPPTIRDEVSGVEVPNVLYEAYQDGRREVSNGKGVEE